MKRNRKVRALMMLPIGIAAVGVFGLIVMSLWNAILPDVFGWKAIGFWQALGLLILCRLLIGGLGGGAMGGRRSRRRLHERWAEMTPEERERLREGLRAGFGHAGPPPPKPAE